MVKNFTNDKSACPNQGLWYTIQKDLPETTVQWVKKWPRIHTAHKETSIYDNHDIFWITV